MPASLIRTLLIFNCLERYDRFAVESVVKTGLPEEERRDDGDDDGWWERQERLGNQVCAPTPDNPANDCIG